MHYGKSQTQETRHVMILSILEKAKLKWKKTE
jgi:hypothetical protein